MMKEENFDQRLLIPDAQIHAIGSARKFRRDVCALL